MRGGHQGPRRRRAAALALAALALAGGGLLAHPGHDEIERRDEPTAELRGDHEGEERSERAFALRRQEGARDVQVAVYTQVHSGRVAWRLLDASGDEVFALVADDGKARGGSGRLDCASGRCDGDWRLELEAEGDATWTLRVWGMTLHDAPGGRPRSR